MKYFVFSDLHGNRELFDQIKNFLNEQGEWKCIVLGDVIDRGDDGYNILQEILNDNRFVLVQGNHEAIFINVCRHLCDMQDEEMWSLEQLKQYVKDAVQWGSDWTLEHYFSNGGASTLSAWLKADCPRYLIKTLDELPLVISYNQYDMIHAGCSAWKLEREDYEWTDTDNYDAVWNRSHFIQPQDWLKDRILIHGHTPVCNMPMWARKNATHGKASHHTWEPMIYNDGQKICMDSGAFHSGHISLMDLDTGEFHHFTTSNALPLDF